MIMKHVPSQKDKRKAAEASILRNMRTIKKQLSDHRTQDEPVDKEQVMHVLTRFMDLKDMKSTH
jgi:hypothetical protein